MLINNPKSPASFPRWWDMWLMSTNTRRYSSTVCICSCCTEVKESWACSWATCRSHLQTSASKSRDQGNFFPSLGHTHTHRACFKVFDTPHLSRSHRQLNNIKQTVHWIKCQHYQSSVSKHIPSHFYQASILEIVTGTVEPHWVTQLSRSSHNTEAFHPAGRTDTKSMHWILIPLKLGAANRKKVWLGRQLKSLLLRKDKGAGGEGCGKPLKGAHIWSQH